MYVCMHIVTYVSMYFVTGRESHLQVSFLRYMYIVQSSKLFNLVTRQMLQHRGGEPSTNYSEFEIHACLFFRNLSKVIKGLSG